MNIWTIVALALAVIYTCGFFALWSYTGKLALGAIWPLTLFFMLFGNIQ